MCACFFDLPAADLTELPTATLCACADATLFNSLITGTVTKALNGSNSERLKTAVSLVGALAKSAPTKMGKKAADLVPLILKAAAKDGDELREGALQVSPLSNKYICLLN